ncbi:MAG: alanine--tRNA ligase, partial [Pseudomonadota bacterium]
CSEIFFDHGDHIWGGPPGSPEEDGDRFVEIWNLVFMQFEQVTVDERINLPKPSIDTGMGLERIAAVLQGTHDNYEIDLFKALIGASEEVIGAASTADTAASHRVIADHLRASGFLIADGVLPSNEGRGYVLRRIMRRAMRHASLLGASEPVMWKLVSALVEQMGNAYPELQRSEQLIAETLKLEETRFRKTLARGLDLLDTASADLNAGDSLDGEVAFKLYDTYGFPLDLTQDALRRRDISVDTDAYDAAMERQKAEARASWAGSGGSADEAVWFKLREEHGATEFLGYDTEKAEGAVQAIIVNGELADSASSGTEVALVLNQTPFYGESGGQMGDAGTLSFSDTLVEITDTKKKAEGLFVHFGIVSQGTISKGDGVVAEVNHARRYMLRSNHSGTHLLHEALRVTLGDHVAQRGSLVAPERLRFDFAHPKPVTAEELSQVDVLTNQFVMQNSPVSTTLMGVDEAIELGAQAQFGEKYGDEVRVVSMGRKEDGKPWSLELCGGTHVDQTGDIGLVTIVSEAAVASGVRRVEALTGDAARHYLQKQESVLRQAAAALKSTPADVPARVATLLEERKKMERELAEAKKKLALGGDGGSGPMVETINGIPFAGRVVEGVSARDLKGMVDEQKTQLGSGVVFLAARSDDDKAAIVVGVSDDLTDRVNAVDLVRLASQEVGGKGGGGRPDMAQAGGPDGANINAAMDAVRSALE